MIEFNKITISGFRSFDQPCEFEFGRGSFCMLVGQNKSDPRLGSNGAGKSTVWDALTWVLYGKTSRGLKSGDVRHWDAGKDTRTEVRLRFKVQDERHELIRSWKPNSLTLDGAEVEERDVVQLIGLEYECFLHVVLMGQFSTFFFDLKPTAKLDLFSDVLRLGVWEQASKEAKRRASEADEQIAEGDKEVARLEGRIEEASHALATEEERQEGRRADATANKREAKREERKQAAALEEATANAQRLRSDRLALKERVAEAHETLGDLSDEKREFEIERAGLMTERGACNRDAKALRKQIGKIKKHEDDDCPWCGQRIDKERCEELLETLRQRRHFVILERDKIDDRVAEADAAIAEIEDALEVEDKRASKLDKRIDKLDEAITLADRNVSKFKAQLGRIQERLAALDKAEEGMEKQIARRKKEVQEMKKNLRRKRRDVSKVKLHHATLSTLAQRFKEVRLWIIETALTELEVHVNNSLLDLGLEGWKIGFDIERENKSGGLTKGFHTTITSPKSSGEVKWEAWSGGELQRLRIAGTIGLAKLIASRLGVFSNIEVWDEPTHHLTAQGIEDVLAHFDDRARSEGKEVWLVDHRSLDHGRFDRVACVEKNEQGNSTIKEIQ